MSEGKRDRIRQLKTEELVDFALEHLGPEHSALRKAALQEHWSRVERAPGTLEAPPGDTQILRAKLSELIGSTSV